MTANIQSAPTFPSQCLIHMRTILYLPHTGLDVVERQLADLVANAVEIHVGGRLMEREYTQDTRKGSQHSSCGVAE